MSKSLIAGTIPQEVDNALATAGWQFDSAANVWHRGSNRLQGERRRAGWLSYTVAGQSLVASHRQRLLEDNLRLNGPCKFVGSGSKQAQLRLDLPLPDEGRGGRSVHFGPTDMQPPGAYVHELTEMLDGSSHAVEPVALDGPAIVAQMKDAGWNAEWTDDQAQFHLPLPGAFAQARLQPSADGTRLVSRVSSLHGLPTNSLKAICALAVEVNDRLPWVRMAVDGRHQDVPLWAEVHLGRKTPVGDWWLSTALEVLESALHMLLRPCQALQHRELADPYIASAAVSAVGSVPGLSKKGGK